MTGMRDDREIIPAGEQQFGYEHLFPVVRLLIQRGHLPTGTGTSTVSPPVPVVVVCRLTRSLTDETGLLSTSDS